MRWHGKCPHVLNAPPTLGLSLYGVSFFPFFDYLSIFCAFSVDGFFFSPYFLLLYLHGGGVSLIISRYDCCTSGKYKYRTTRMAKPLGVGFS